MIFILSKEEKVINILKNFNSGSNSPSYYNDLLVEDLGSGSETFSFSTIGTNKNTRDLAIGNYIAFRKGDKYKLFQIMQIEETHEETILIDVYCESASLELANNIFRKRKLTSVTLEKFIETVLEDTEWKLGSLELSHTDSLDLELDDATVYATLQNNIAKFGYEISFRCEVNNGRIAARYVDLYRNKGRLTGRRFTFGKDIEKITRKIDSTELFTAMIGTGKHGLTFSDLEIEGIEKPIGQDYVVDENAFKRYGKNGYHIMGLFHFETESKQELLRETYKKLMDHTQPKIEYTIDVALLEEMLGESLKNIAIGDTVAIVDNAFNPPIHLMARVNRLETSMTDPQANKCVLANFIEVSSNITDEMRKLASQLEGYVDGSLSSKFPISGEDIENGAIGPEHIYKNTITTDHLIAGVVTAEKIHADVVEAIEGKFDKLEVGKAEITDLEATNATIGVLEAKVGKIDYLESDMAVIKDLVTGNLSSENIQVGGLTGDRLNMKTVFIDDANIIDVNASKINAGTINTNKVSITSEDGSIAMIGSTQQFKDENDVVRIQMGKDTNGDFNFILRGEDGKGVLIDHTGIKEGAIPDDLINGDMIGSNVIGEKNINYTSFITGFNEDTNTNTIKSTKIKVDNKNQTLDVAFDQMESTVQDNVEKTNINSTKIQMQQGQISQAIEATTIEKDGETILLKDDYNRTVSKVDSNSMTLGSHATKIDENSGKIKEVDIKTSSILQDLDGIKLEVESKSSKLETDEKIKEAIANQQTIIDVEFKEVSDSIESLKNLSDDIFKDGIVDIAEKEALLKQKSILEKEHKDIISQSSSIINSSEILGTDEKQELVNNKAALEDSFNKILAEFDKTLGTAYKMSRQGIIVDPTEFTFEPTQEIVITHNNLDVTYGYLYGLDGVIISENYEDNKLIFPPHETLGTYRCYFGTYIGNDWVQSNDFTIIIEEKTIEPPPPEPDPIYPDSVELDKKTISIFTGNEDTLIATIKPTDADDKTLRWSTLDSKIATVVNGVVTGISKGQTDIVVKTHNDKQDICKVTVREFLTGEGIEVAIKNYIEQLALVRESIQKCLEKISQVKSDRVDKKYDNRCSSIEQKADEISFTVKNEHYTISDTKKAIKESIDAYKKEVDKEFADVGSSVESIKNLTDDIFKDGVIDIAEREALNKQKAILEKEHKDIISQAEVVEKSTELQNTSEKDIVTNNKVALESRFVDVLAEFNKLETTQVEIEKVIDLYVKQLSLVREALQKGLEKIAQVKSDIVDSKYDNRCSKIEQKADQISMTVETINNKTDHIEQNLTEFKQTSEEFQFNIVSRGGNNELKNSDFANFEIEENEFGIREINIAHWKKYGYLLELGMNIIAMDVIGYSSRWGYKSKTENTIQISDKNSYATGHENTEMSAYTLIKTEKGRDYTLSFLCAAHRVNKIYASARDWEDNAFVFKQEFIEDIPSGGEDNTNWKKVSMTFKARSVSTRIEIGIFGKTEPDPYLWFTKPMLNKGTSAAEYTSSNKELVNGITTIDEDGIKIEMSDSEGKKGHTRINYEGLSVYDKNGTRKAWFGEGESAYIKNLSAENITNRQLIKWSEGRPVHVYVAPNATGDGTGRDVNNKSNSINHTLNWIWNNYGCYSWQRNLWINVEAGTYTEDIYIGGWIGTGEIYLNIDGQATIYGSHRIEENTMAVTIQGRTDFDTWSDWGAWFKFRRGTFDNDELFHIRRSNVLIRGCRAVKEGYNSEYNNWNGYTNKFVRAGEGSQVYVYNCVAVGFYHFGYAIYNSILSMHKNRGHCDINMYLLRGSIGMLSNHTPICKQRRDWSEGCIYDENTIGTEHNDNTYPKQEPSAPPPPPPPPPPSFIWAENTFNASNLRTFTEGSGSATSNRTGMWGQGNWGSYKAHRGYADLGGGPSSWCSGGRNITAWITLKRITNGGYSGEVPIPRIKRPDGSFWNSGVAFAHGQTKTIQLPSDIANAIANGSMTTLEMWVGQSNTHYAFFDHTTIKIKCEKPT